MNFFNVWKTMWKQIWKAKLVLLLMLMLIALLFRDPAADLRSQLIPFCISAGIFVVFDLLAAAVIYRMTRRGAPYYQLIEESGPCEEAVQMHRHIFPDPTPSERLSLADLLLALYRTDEAEAELMQIRPEGLSGLPRLRYLNSMLLVYAYSGRRQQLWTFFQSCRQEAGMLAEKHPIVALSYYNTAQLACSLNGDVNGSELYCQYTECEAEKKHGSGKVNARLLAMITRTERLYALGSYGEAEAQYAQTLAAIQAAHDTMKPKWQYSQLLSLLDHARIFAPYAANHNTGVTV